MSEQINNGGPAFPQVETTVHMEGGHDGYTPLSDVHSVGGMTLRDYFAAKIAAALITTAGGPCLGGLDGYESHTAVAAYRMSDAMLAARGDA